MVGGEERENLCCAEAGNKVKDVRRQSIRCLVMLAKVKDMFVMNFGAVPRDPENGDWSFIIPNDAITDPNGFPGAGMPLLWLLNANEGSGYPLRVVNFLWGYAHRRDVYAAIVVPSEDEVPKLGHTFGPIWDIEGAPIVEVNVNGIKNWGQVWGVDELLSLAMVIGHELGHTVLWHIDHNPSDNSQHFGGNQGHHVVGHLGGPQGHGIMCLMWPFFPPRICPSGFALCYPSELYPVNYCPNWQNHWEKVQGEWRPKDRNLWTVFTPTEFCDANPGCQNLWRLQPP